MSASQQHLADFLLILIILISVCCKSNGQKICSSYADYIGNDTKGKDITFGDCSFEGTLCNYTQGCTDNTANNWTVLDGRAVCPGHIYAAFESFSVLLSPLLSIKQNTSLMFSYNQSPPGKLSVFVATRAGITEVFSERDGEGSFQTVYISLPLAKIGFRARTANLGCNVTLSHVKLAAVSSYTTTTKTWSTRDQSVTIFSTQTAHVTIVDTTTTPYQSITVSSTQKVMPVEENQDGGSNAGIIAGVLVAVVAVVVAGVIAGIFVWRSRKQRHNNRNDGQEFMKDTQDIYHGADTREKNETTIAPDNKHTQGVSGTSINQYDIPRHGLSGRNCLVTDERACVPDLASSADDDEHYYQTLEDHNELDASEAQCIYSFARNEEGNFPSADNSGGNYDTTELPGVMPRWESESSLGPVDDDYSHIVSTDKPIEKEGRRSTQGLASGRHDSDCDENTSRDDEDGYNVLCAGNKQPSGFNEKKNTSAKAYDHVTGNLHEDYDRIRQGDRNNVIGSDYDHVM